MTRNRWLRGVAIALGLVTLAWANYYLRATLEDSPRYMHSFLERFYEKDLPSIFAMPTWRLFMPLPQITGAWAATTLLAVYLTEQVIGSPGAWYLFNILSILVAFGTSWILFRSAVFSFTFAICVGFGTQFYHAYAVTGGIASPLLWIYHALLLFSIAQVVRGATPRWAWWIVFAISLFLNFFGYEGWLDVLVLVCVSLPFVYVGLRRLDQHAAATRMARVTAGLVVAGIVYVLVKVNYGFGQVQGSESDVVFNYDSAWLVADDLISNVFTHSYLAISNFLPPLFVGSSGMYRLGAQHLIDAQHLYHEPFLYLVPMHHVFFWRYYAGAAFVLLGVAVYAMSRRMWRHPSAWTLALIVFLLMLVVPGSTHTLIKFRPMNAMPVMTYHITLGVVGAAGVIAWLTASAWRRSRRPAIAIAIVTGVWALIFYGSLARPMYLAHMAAQAGLGEFVYPNPMKTLFDQLGWRYDAPRGVALYRLMPYQRDEAFSVARNQLPELPGKLPPVDQWERVSVQSAMQPAAAGGFEFEGDNTQFGYQLMTPPIFVQPGLSYVVRARFEPLDGRTCLGILTGDQQRWIVPPDGTSIEYPFSSAGVEAFRLVIANCNLSDIDNPVTKVRVSGGSYAALSVPEPRP